MGFFDGNDRAEREALRESIEYMLSEVEACFEHKMIHNEFIFQLRHWVEAGHDVSHRQLQTLQRYYDSLC